MAIATDGFGTIIRDLAPSGVATAGFGTIIKNLAGSGIATAGLGTIIKDLDSGDSVAPTLVGNPTIDASGTLLTITMSEALDPTSIPTVTLNGATLPMANGTLAVAVGAAVVSGTTITQALAPGVIAGETGLKVSTSGAPIQDLAGNDVTHLVDQAVANTSMRVAQLSDVAGYVFDADAQSPSTFTQSAGVVTSLTNKVSGVALTVVGTPTYLATGLNGKPAFDTQGTNQGFRGTEAAVVAAGTNANDRSVFVVASLNNIDVFDALFSWANSGVDGNRVIYFGQNTSGTPGKISAFFLNDAGAQVSLTGTIPCDSTPHVYGYVMAAGTLAAWRDQVLDLPLSAFNPATNTVNCFGLNMIPDLSPNSFEDAQVGQWVLYNRAVTSTEQAYISKILQAKWNTPPLSSGLVAWFDLQDPTSFEIVDDVIESITNKASGEIWSPVGSPAYLGAGINAKPCIYFDGVDDGILGVESSVVQAVSVGHTYTIFWVGEPDVLDRDDTVFSIYNSASANGTRSWGKNTFNLGSWSLTTVTDAPATVTAQTTHRAVPGTQVHCWHASTTNVSHELNSGATGATDLNNVGHAPGATTSNRAAIGCCPGLNQFFKGKLGELVVYDRRLSGSEILQVSTYLRNRWPTTQLEHVITQGDSITNGSSGGRPVYQLLDIPDALISNVATGGRKAWQVLQYDIDDEMIQFCASGSVISWLMLGSNDGTTGTGLPGSYSSVATFLTDLAAVITRLRSLQITSVVSTVWYRDPAAPLPGGLYGTWGNNPDFNGWVDQVNAAIMAEGDGGIYGDFIEDGFTDWWTAGGYSLLGPDGIHPTDPGSDVLAATAQRGIDRALAAQV